ncbi:isochorismatase family protein [Flavisphingomonas formosensis]|uniref:isochorismatase family protein n=1 Tax=Flavisphingomonas formosensis TaxID=861534 RepID=UPI0012FA3283|nr:isochorismatase family protein [Sphingomonas formosensis]
MTPLSTDVLVIIDVQNDFVNGALGQPGADAIIEPINALVRAFEHVVVVKDWHPKDHISFATNHPGAKIGDQVDVPYGKQPLYHEHCVQGTYGAELDARLDVMKAELILQKGYRSSTDSLSAFYEADDTTTGLGAYAKAREFERVFLTGLARYGCVLASAVGSVKDGFETYIVHDATAGDYNVEECDKLIAELGIRWITSSDLVL